MSQDFEPIFHRAREQSDAQILIDALPYAASLGMKVADKDGHFHLPPIASNIGNPTLPAIHGGAIAGFMEMSAVVYLLMTMDIDRLGGQLILPRLVDISIDYVRASRYVDTFAVCEVVRQGRKWSNLSMRIYQGDESNVTATARAHYLIG